MCVWVRPPPSPLQNPTLALLISEFKQIINFHQHNPLVESSFNNVAMRRKDNSLKIESENLEDRQAQLTIELPDDRLNSAMRAAAKRLGRKTKVHGFRPGKAPYTVLLNQLGEDLIFDEALEHLGQEIYKEALEETEIEAFAQGSLEEIVSRDPLVLRFTIPLAPDIQLGAYRDLRLSYEEPEVDDEALDRVMDDLRERQALIEPADRPAELSDVVVMEVHATLDDDGEESKLIDEKSVSVLVAEDVDWPIPGIADELIGMQASEEKSFEYTFPEDYAEENMQGKSAEFRVKIHEVKSRLIPEWSDDLAKNLGEFDDLLALRIKVRQDLEEEAQRQTKASYASDVITAIVDDSEVKFPPILLREELNDLLHDLQQRLRYQNLSLEDYLKIENKSEEELIEELSPQAEERLTRALVLGKIVELENIEVEDSEVETELERILEGYKENQDDARKLFDNPVGRRRIKLDLVSDKAVERLIAIAKGESDILDEASKQPTSSAESSKEPVEMESENPEEQNE